MAFFESLLHPVVIAMGFILQSLHAATGSYGVAIVLLSVTIQIIAFPVSRIGKRYEERERELQAKMASALSEARSELKGRARFERIERIYEDHGYHPYQSLASIVPLLIQIPFFIGAFILLTDLPGLRGESFLFIRDLSQPDGLIAWNVGNIAFRVNALPLALSAVAIAHSSLTGGSWKFIAITVVLAILIYPLPAAVCLYWFSSNVCLFLAALVSYKRTATT